MLSATTTRTRNFAATPEPPAQTHRDGRRRSREEGPRRRFAASRQRSRPKDPSGSATHRTRLPRHGGRCMPGAISGTVALTARRGMEVAASSPSLNAGRTGSATLRRFHGDTFGPAGAPSFEALGAGPAHLGRPSQTPQSADDRRAAVDLPGVDAVAGAGRVDVVQVVPALSHGQDRERPAVRGLVAASEWPVPRDVADAVHG